VFLDQRLKTEDQRLSKTRNLNENDQNKGKSVIETFINVNMNNNTRRDDEANIC